MTTDRERWTEYYARPEVKARAAARYQREKERIRKLNATPEARALARQYYQANKERWVARYPANAEYRRTPTAKHKRKINDYLRSTRT